MRDNKKRRILASKYDIFKVLDALEVLQYNKSEFKVLYVPKRAYKLAKKMLKIEGKADEVKIKTY